MTKIISLTALVMLWASVSLAAPATVHTQQKQNEVLSSLPFTDQQAFLDAKRGFMAALPDGKVLSADGAEVWNMAPYSFLDAEHAPYTVNPSLWRQAKLNQIHGLFKVTPSIYQVRGMDLANMTIVEGQSGLIIIDPLLTQEAAAAALALYQANRPQKPVVAVIYTHSHVDHFGGVKGVTTEEAVAKGEVQIIAPQGFMHHAVSENVIAGNAMTRRANYMYGLSLKAGPEGHVDIGLGKNLSRGTVTLIAPTKQISTQETHVIDGVEIEFFMASGSEAPAEFMLYFPKERVLNTAEVTSQHLHNIYTIRGAEVRDASAWSRYIDQVRETYGARTDILIAQHHWPIWSQSEALEYLAKQRDLYKYIHDQSVRLMNQGFGPEEIAERLKMPQSLANTWSARGYYGTVKHNAKAIYQKYLGWYNANPAHLDPPVPVERARKTIEYMGGVEKVMEQAQADYEKGNYRWVAWVMDQVVFSDPTHTQARALAAAALEQLGYQAESGVWRNAYLSGAQDLRGEKGRAGIKASSTDIFKALEVGMFFDLLAVRLNGEKAQGKHVVLNWHFTDTNERYRLNLENAALTWLSDIQAPDAHATLTLTRETLNQIL